MGIICAAARPSACWRAGPLKYSCPQIATAGRKRGCTGKQAKDP